MDTWKGTNFEEEKEKEEASGEISFIIIDGDEGNQCNEPEEQKETESSRTMEGTANADDAPSLSHEASSTSSEPAGCTRRLLDRARNSRIGNNAADESEITQRLDNSATAVSGSESIENSWEIIYPDNLKLSGDVKNVHHYSKSAAPPLSAVSTEVLLSAIWSTLKVLTRDIDIIRELGDAADDAIGFKNGIIAAMAGADGVRNGLKKLESGNRWEALFEIVSSAIAVVQGVRNAGTGGLSLCVKIPALIQLIRSVYIRGGSIQWTVRLYLSNSSFNAAGDGRHHSSSATAEFATAYDDTDGDRRLNSSSTDLQPATAAADIDNNPRLANCSTDLRSATAGDDNDSDRNRRLTGSSGVSTKGVDGVPKELQK